MELSQLLPLLIGGGGLAALIFGALRFNRQDAGEVVTQAKDVMASMRELIDELQADRDRLQGLLDTCRRERDEFREKAAGR
jgi:ABC-type transporter Mla subunit MlaD